MQGEKIKTAYRSLAAKHKVLHTLAALLLVLLLSVTLASWRQNGSTYATGLWDDGSQSLVFGRMLQMQQNQSARGGFMGVYTPEWGDSQNRYLYRDNTPVAAEDYMSYTHQTGLQGLGFAVANKLLTVFEDRGEAREAILYTLNSVLFYMATLGVCIAIWRGMGLLPAALWLAAAVYAPWVQRGMKDLYWCLWTWLLPALAAILLCFAAQKNGRVAWQHYALVFAACMLRCACGFEFVSVILILCEIPLVYCWAQATVQKQPARPWLGRMVGTGIAAVAGVTGALLLWFVQGCVYYGSAAQSWLNITGAVSTRVSVSDNAVRATTVGQVIAKYLMGTDPVLQLGGVGVTVLQMLGFGAAALAVTALLLAIFNRSALKMLLPPVLVWVLGFVAPISWMVLSKAHADIHVQLIPMLWNFAFVPATCMLAGALLTLLFRSLMKQIPNKTNPQQGGTV